MPLWSVIARRWRALFNRDRVEREMDDELQLHLEMQAHALQHRGLGPDAARRAAMHSFHGMDHVKEAYRDARGVRTLEDVMQDVRYAGRQLWKNRALTLIAVVSLAVGIGANAAIFGVVNSVLFRARPVANPEQLVQLYTGDRTEGYHSVSYPSFLDFRAHTEIFTGLAAHGIAQFRLGNAEGVEEIWGEPVSGNYFDVLGVHMTFGRGFVAAEDSVPGRNPVVVIGHDLWRRRFAGDAQIVGKTLTLNNQPLTIVGVAPKEFTGMMGGMSADVWVPVMMMPLLDRASGELMVSSRGSRWVTLVGRLQPGMTIDQARLRFEVIAAQMREAHPEEWKREAQGPNRELRVLMLPESATRVHPDMRIGAYALAALLFVIVDLVLLIACMNLMSVLFARAVTRRNEMAVRLALGAGRARIVRQLLTENMLVAILAGAAGILLAVWSLKMLVAAMPPLPEGFRVALDPRVDWRVVAYTFAFTTVAGLLFGLAPALHASRAPVSVVLKDDAGAASVRHRTSRARRGLVIAQVAFSSLLLIAATLVLRSLSNVRPTQLGFSSEQMVVASLEMEEAGYDRRRGHQFFDQIAERVAAMPGVQSVSLVDPMPGGFMGRARRGTEIEGYTPRSDESLSIDATIVGPGYFTNMKVPIVEGRDFTARDRDGAPCVTMVNEAFARRYFAASPSAVGKRIANAWGPRGKSQMCAIVGVFRDDAWQSLNEEPRPVFALPLLQTGKRDVSLLVHTNGAPASLVPAVRKAIRETDPSMPVADVQTLGQFFAMILYPFRLVAVVMAACGALALLLASIGIYGIISHSVAERRREVGIRMALGASRRDILNLVVGQGMLLVGYGLAAGLLLAFALTRVLTALPFKTDLLFGVGATDPVTFGGVTALLVAIALVACYVPALRATKSDPLLALRSS